MSDTPKSFEEQGDYNLAQPSALKYVPSVTLPNALAPQTAPTLTAVGEGELPNRLEDQVPSQYLIAGRFWYPKDAVDSLWARAIAQRDEAREAVSWANNSLYGSLGYFLSLNGGPPDKYHLANGIEERKRLCGKEYERAEAAEAKLALHSAD